MWEGKQVLASLNPVGEEGLTEKVRWRLKGEGKRGGGSSPCGNLADRELTLSQKKNRIFERP